MSKTLVHSATDPETGKPLKDYYAAVPITEGQCFDACCNGEIFQFQMVAHFLTDETMAVVKFVGASKSKISPMPKTK